MEADGPMVLIAFTDGSTGTLQDGQSALRGRTLEQIRSIEMHPSEGGVVQGTRHDGVAVVGISYRVRELPFPIVAFVPTETAKVVGEQLIQTATGLIIANKMP